MNHPVFAFNLPHGWEWIAILLIVVLLFGADKLPKLARGIGKSLGEFRKAKDDFEKEIHAAANEPPKAGTPPANGAAPSETIPTDALTKKI